MSVSPVRVSLDLASDGRIGVGLDVDEVDDESTAGPPMGLEGATPPAGDLPMPGGGLDPFGYDPSGGLGGGMPPPRGVPQLGSPRGGVGLAPLRSSHKKHEEALRFAASAASAQGSLPALFKEGSLSVLRPSNKPSTAQNAFLEVFPRASSRKPALLVQLESLLAEKLRLTEKLVEVRTRPGRYGHGGNDDGNFGDDAPWEPEGVGRYDPSGTLTLEAYRQTFEAFINAFSTYRPLLTRVKEQYDRALDQALRSEHENVHLRSELAAMERRRQKAVESARAETNAVAASLRGELVDRLQTAEERAAACEEAATGAKEEAERLRAELAEMTAKYEATLAVNKELKQDMLNEASWGEKPSAERMLGMSLGPVPKNFPRMDVKLEEGEGGISKPDTDGPPLGPPEEAAKKSGASGDT